MQSQGMYQQVTIDGLEQLTKALAMAGLMWWLKDISKATGTKLVRDVKPLTPVGPTGNLRSTYGLQDFVKVFVLLWVQKKTPYAGFVEFGGSLIHAVQVEEYLLLDLLG